MEFSVTDLERISVNMVNVKEFPLKAKVKF